MVRTEPEMRPTPSNLIFDTWTLARDLLFAPSRGVKRLLEPRAALPEAVYLYALFLIASILFYTFKPADFPPPDPNMELPRSLGGTGENQGLWFWTRVEMWSPFLTAVWALFLAWLSGFLKSSRLRGPLALLLASLFGVVPVIPILLYTNNVIPRSALAFFWAALIAAMVPRLKKRATASWKPLVALVLTIDVVNLALLIPFIIAVMVRSAGMYYTLEMAMLVWTLGLGAYALSRIDGLTTSRAFTAIFISLLGQFWLVFSLYFLGLVPKDILKAMMSV